MLRTLLCDENNRFLVIEDPSQISEIVQRKDRHLWLDLEQPTLAEFSMIQEEFNLHPLAIEDAMARHQRPKVDQYESFYLVVFYAVTSEEPDKAEAAPTTYSRKNARFVTSSSDGHEAQVNGANDGTSNSFNARGNMVPAGQKTNNERIVLREITMFMGENYLITVHTRPVAELEEAAKRWRQNVRLISGAQGEGNPVAGTRALTPQEQQATTGLLPAPAGNGNTTGQALDSTSFQPDTQDKEAQQKKWEAHVKPDNQANSIGILLYSLLDTIVDSYFPVIDSIVDRVEDLEEQIFEKYNQAAIESIFTLKKDLLALRKVLAPERDVLNMLTRRDLPIFEQNTLLYFQDIYDHITRITDSIDTYRDLLSSALDSFLSMQSNRLNITVQTLTSVSIILMSVSAVTGWYGMNFANMPELSTQYGYLVVIAVVATVVILEYLFFKRKRWL
ncbi:MAG: magnesium/cobalt transporter CorA [Chloroflexi bacterium]|nr:magnesium/cobalt transporter CorA [Chloroflexota bacterium]